MSLIDYSNKLHSEWFRNCVIWVYKNNPTSISRTFHEQKFKMNKIYDYLESSLTGRERNTLSTIHKACSLVVTSHNPSEPKIMTSLGVRDDSCSLKSHICTWKHALNVTWRFFIPPTPYYKKSLLWNMYNLDKIIGFKDKY